MNDKIVLQITTTKNKKEQLKQIAKQEGFTMSGIVNRLINDYINKKVVK